MIEPRGDAVRAASRSLLTLRDLAVAPLGAAKPVLRDIALDVGAGECLALVGASGTGKTTLLRTLGGQIAAVAGTIELDGEWLTALRGKALRRLRSRVGFVAQKHDLVEPLRVHQNVMAGALGRWSTLRALRYLCRPTSAELAEARSALEAVGLAHKLRAPTAALSGGEQQRVAIARALVQAPRLLLADEPVASLDPVTARAILELLTSLAKRRGMALICSLHQPELATRYFDRVLEVREGTLTGSAAVHAAQPLRLTA
ncbi:MAG: ATP-binding cassette domain-containing protein [Nevskia sp.]|nr:ATP-binding cassette domain-containing protein [Nevskia sp.]